MDTRLKKIIDESDNIVFFGGAGVSVPSGIPDFRSSNGLYSKNPEYLLSIDYFNEDKEGFSEFYKKNLVYLDAKPNKAHMFLTKLEKIGKLKAVITQNIDNLHQLAGTKNVIELHGSLYRQYCIKCKKKYTIYDVMKDKGISRCSCGGVIRPDITLYGEMLDYTSSSRAIKYIQNADVLIVAGTSLSVYPAAGYIRYFNGRKLVLINMTKTNMDYIADLVIYDDIEKVLGE